MTTSPVIQKTVVDLCKLTRKSRPTILNCLTTLTPEKKGVSKLYPAHEALPLIYGKAFENNQYNLNNERGRVSHHDANMKAMREEEMRGDLVRVDDISEKWSRLTGNWKTKILAVPSNVVHELSQTNDKNEILKILNDALFDAFTELVHDDTAWATDLMEADDEEA